jgi:hypothetical protein
LKFEDFGLLYGTPIIGKQRTDGQGKNNFSLRGVDIKKTRPQGENHALQ